MGVKKCHCEEGLPEWIMSYADMITILMAFFVVMYSMAGDNKDEEKAEKVMHSLRVWLGGYNDDFPTTRTQKAPVGGKGKGQFDERPEDPLLAKRKEEDSLVSGGTIFVQASAEAFSEEQKATLRRVAEAVAGKRNLIEIRGQAGRRPLPTQSAFRDPMDASYARCRQAMQFLAGLGIEPERMQVRVPRSASANNADALLASSDTRLDVFLLNDFMTGQPGAEAKAADTTHAVEHAHAKPHTRGPDSKPKLANGAEVDLGEYAITIPQQGAGATLLVKFHLYGTVSEESQARFTTMFETSKHRLRDQVLRSFRSAPLADLADPDLTTIRQEVLEGINHATAGLLEEVIFSDFVVGKRSAPPRSSSPRLPATRSAEAKAAKAEGERESAPISATHHERTSPDADEHQALQEHAAHDEHHAH